MRKKYISVFINKQGVEDYDYGYGSKSENVIQYTMTEEELYDLAKTRFFAIINERCNLMIENYESEWLKPEDVETCIKVYNTLALPRDSIMYKAFIQAREYGYGMAFDF